ncbi:cytochrome P450 [Mollisia scopiformis]|uniref:Cytochrome P450 n=1 Tax=Mollisia scopiformis TaxID=149040 RepID=A0A194WTH9_MOLSC|nr:cytochrome P450 [Mollisia scopiformis]KUJ11266.1 cytochrome P450 [Mollisia scopiformis]
MSLNLETRDFFLLPLVSSILLTIVYFLFNEIARYTARVKGLKGPRGLPVVGNLHQATAEQHRLWAKEYGPVFQIQLGNVPVVVVNSAAAAKNLFLTQTSALNSRPVFHVFHKIVSKNVLSIGTSPWDDSCKRRRKAAATALNRSKTESYLPILNLEVTEWIRDLYEEGNGGALAFDPTDLTHRLSLNLSLTLNYGFRAESTKDFQNSPLLQEVVHIETEIGKLRSTGSNYSNYIPALRILDRIKEILHISPGPAYGRDIGKRRLAYIAFLATSKQRISKGTDNACIQGGVLKDPEASNLTEEELISISFSMMAGAETTTPTIGWGILFLAHHPDIQAQAYNTIVSGINPSNPLAPGSPQVDYLMAFTKEIMRYYTPLRLALPKATSGPAIWDGTTIPANTMVFLNSWSCNRDPIPFPNPDVFKPERWMKKEGGQRESLSHYTFGYGGRMCVASHVANQGLYMAFLNLVARFELSPGDGVEDINEGCIDPMKGIQDVRATRAGPKGVKVRFVPREGRKNIEK